MDTISKKLKQRIVEIKKQKVIPINQIYQAKKQLQEDIKTVKTIDQLKHLHPIHAIYASAQNLISYLSENLTIFPEFDEYCNIINKAEDEYLPDYPPMSPLTLSYFTSWAFFDVRFGKSKETFGTCIQDNYQEIGLSAEDAAIIKLMQISRMGIYEYQGHSDNYIILNELFTDTNYKCYVASEYYGKEKEIWFARILPTPYNLSDIFIVYTTPYIIIKPQKEQWLQYLEQTLFCYFKKLYPYIIRII